MENQFKQRDTAGIVILYNDQILLVHPKNGSWVKPVMGIPKGRIDDGEEHMAAAIRETFEETGIYIKPEQLGVSPSTIEVHDKNGKYKNTIYYYVCRINELSEIGLTSTVVPKSQLQEDEIDWAGFINVKSAYGKIANAQKILLDRLS